MPTPTPLASDGVHRLNILLVVADQGRAAELDPEAARLGTPRYRADAPLAPSR